MLGAQALRTKQKVEQKEKEKRQKDRVRKLELQRERIQKVAHEDAQAMIEAATNQMQYLQLQENRGVNRHYSLHAHAIQDQLRPIVEREKDSSPARDPRVHIQRRSPSSDFGRLSLNHQSVEIQNGGGNRLMKWLGFSSGSSAQKREKRRMSTY